jgi:dethiobiotin synthetase
MTHGYFVTGTDTGVGKTLIACGLLRAFAACGYRAVGMKPVAAGAEPRGDHVVYGDVEALCAAGNVAAPREVMNPYAFRRPIAPHIAAAEEGVVIDLDQIERSFRALAGGADAVVVEGAGGFRVPLGPATDTGELARRLGLPVILVVGIRLGCLNHALLTADSIAAHGLSLAGWVANHVDPDMSAADENVAALEARLPARLLARVRHAATPSSDAVGHLLAHIVPRRNAGANLL